MLHRLRAALLFAVLLLTAGTAAGQTETPAPAWPSWCQECFRVKMVLPGVMYSMEVGGVDETGDFVTLDPLTFTWLRKTENHYMGAEEQFHASGYWYIQKGVKFDPKRYKESVAAYQQHLAKLTTTNQTQVTDTKLRNEIHNLQAQLEAEKQTTTRLEAELAQAQATIQKLSREAKQQPPAPAPKAVPPIPPTTPKAATTHATPPKKQVSAAKAVPPVSSAPKTAATPVPPAKKQVPGAAKAVPSIPTAPMAKAAPPPPAVIQCDKTEFSLVTRKYVRPANNEYSQNYAYCKAEAERIASFSKDTPIDLAKSKTVFLLIVGTLITLCLLGFGYAMHREVSRVKKGLGAGPTLVLPKAKKRRDVA